ncbi:MAG: S-layer homology domain-containing protein [Synergistaceae bacterium]|nr:S-layer homology domain-containing protein [Synergistaceae bacterium]
MGGKTGNGRPVRAFKDPQPATRYEVASVVARALAYADTVHASKQDLEMLKKLVMEFKDELDALGVKVDKLDKRVAVLENNLGGWKLSGQFRFDAKFTNGDQDEATQFTANTAKNEFTKEYFRLFLTKYIDENTTLDTEYRIGAWAASNTHKGLGDVNQQSWNKVYITTKLPWDVRLRLGRFGWDWESDEGLYNSFDALFGDYRGDGFELKKTWNTFSGTALVMRNFNNEGEQSAVFAGEGKKSMTYALKLDWKPNDKLFLSGIGNWMKGDGIVASGDVNGKVDTYGIFAGYKFTPSIQLKGAYYWQKIAYSEFQGAADPDTQKAWKAILDVKQDLLKFTSLWIEYSQVDNGFMGNSGASWGGVSRYGLGKKTTSDKGIFWGMKPVFDGSTAKFWYVRADQKWNKKWSSFINYTQADWDRANLDDAKEWGLGVKYQYTPAVAFTLGYDTIDYGGDVAAKTGGNGAHQGKDNVIYFNTTVKF